MDQKSIANIILDEFPYTKRSVDLLLAGVYSCFPDIGYGDRGKNYGVAQEYAQTPFGSIKARDVKITALAVTQKNDLSEAVKIAKAYEDIYTSLRIDKIPRGAKGVVPGSMPPPISLREWEENIKAKEAGYKTKHEVASEVGERQTQEFIEKQKERVSKSEEPQPENIFVVPQAHVEIISLSDEDKIIIKDLAEKAQTDPDLAKKIADEIVSKIPDEQKTLPEQEILQYTVNWAANLLVDDLKNVDPDDIPDKIEVHNIREVLSAFDSPEVEGYFSNSETYQNFRQATGAVAEQAAEAQAVANDFVSVAYGPNVAGMFFSPRTKGEQAAEKGKEQISLYGISTEDNGKAVAKINIRETDKAIAELKEMASERRKLKSVLRQMNPDAVLSDKEFEELYRQWVYINYIYTGSTLGYTSAASKYKKVGQAEEAYQQGTIFASIYDQVGGRLGLGFYETVIDNKTTVAFGFKIAGKVVPIKGIGEVTEKIAAKFLGPVAKGAAGQTASKAAVAVGGKVVGGFLARTAALQAIGAAIGNLPGWVVSLIITIITVVTEIVSRVKIFIKKHSKELAFGAAAVLFGGAVALGSLPLGIAAGGALVLGAGPAAVASGIVGGIGAVFGGLVSASVATIATGAVITLVVTPILVAVIMFIINTGAYVTPPNLKYGGSQGGGGTVPTDCQDNSFPKPTSNKALIAGNYAFPVSPQGETSYPCYHWDGEYAVDIFTMGTRQPVVAYTSGTVNMVVLDDPYGGKYVILAGDDGRYYYYAHNCAVYVKAGDKVAVGDILAVTDNTGSAAGTPEHLHFAINENAYGNLFVGGGGSVCPQTDFEDKFGLGVCTDATTRCVRP